MNYSTSIWPENINRSCFVVVALDATAPFLSDMGLYTIGIQELRHFVRSRISLDPRLIRGCDSNTADDWVATFHAVAMRELPERTVVEFWRWVEETFVHGPTNRPNWQAYGDFFFEWHSRFRHGKLIADCFDDPHIVFDTYSAFVSLRLAESRIRDRRSMTLSDWDGWALDLGRYEISGMDSDEEKLDPFVVVSASIESNCIQQFWEYLSCKLTNQEKKRLWHALLHYHQGKEWTRNLVSPEELTRQVK
jgi:hypothetical protein